MRIIKGQKSVKTIENGKKNRQTHREKIGKEK